MASFRSDFEQLVGCPPPAITNPRLVDYWNCSVSELCELKDPWVSTEPDQWMERHQLYSRLLMAIVHWYWNGYKKGNPSRGRYPWNDKPKPADPPHLEGDYYGHNIAALAVDGTGRILDFDFNHNEVFNSSAEHAEARLVRRLYSLAQVSDTWISLPAPKSSEDNAAPDQPPGINARLGNVASPEKYTGRFTSLENVTIYTSLESCSQCAGVMALAKVKHVVYLQTDPGMYFIGVILHNLTRGTKLPAPVPISGCEIGFEYFAKLNHGFSHFTSEVEKNPFWIPNDGKPDTDRSVTSFLCTGDARAIYADGGKLPDPKNLKHGSWMPKDSPSALSNAEVLDQAATFLEYAKTNGRRGTPHGP
jgi:tRNA(Arg) A34 adenosine deaminase TadA